jgi:hypothetical protein
MTSAPINNFVLCADEKFKTALVFHHDLYLGHPVELFEHGRAFVHSP